MSGIADILMIAATLAAAVYCHVLARRLRAFTNLESGVGGAVATLARQVDDLQRALSAARVAGDQSAQRLDAANRKAEESARRIELLLAAMHDLPDTPRAAKPAAKAPAKPRNRKVATPVPALPPAELPTFLRPKPEVSV
ncbi:hypothetical protein [Ketogulonicigenium robustum]|nr:hypothetical protein [Ketogulonicigenium robustum]